jgi:hypothetical protein
MKISDLAEHPFNKEPGLSYFYKKDNIIVSDELKKSIIVLRHNKGSVKTHSVQFRYEMYNGDKPTRLFPSIESLREDNIKKLNQNINLIQYKNGTNRRKAQKKSCRNSASS